MAEGIRQHSFRKVSKNSSESIKNLRFESQLTSCALPTDFYELKTTSDFNKHKLKPNTVMDHENFDLKLGNNPTANQRRYIQKGYSFYLNKDFISEILEVDTSKIHPVKNDWQNEELLVPTLCNHLDILP